jgi:hypothetical protein
MEPTSVWSFKKEKKYDNIWTDNMLSDNIFLSALMLSDNKIISALIIMLSDNM